MLATPQCKKWDLFFTKDAVADFKDSPYDFQSPRQVFPVTQPGALNTPPDSPNATPEFLQGATDLNGPIPSYTVPSQDQPNFDPSNRPILERLDQLEISLKAHVSLSLGKLSYLSEYTQATIPTPSITQSLVQCLSMSITVDHVFAWPFFEGWFRPRSLMQVLREETPKEQALVPIPVYCRPPMASVTQYLGNILDKSLYVDEQLIRETVNRVASYGYSFNADICLVLLVCAVGFSVENDGHRARAFFDAAQAAMGVLATCNGIIAPQCYFLAGVYFMYRLRPLDAWKMFSQAVICFHTNGLDIGIPGSSEERVYCLCWKSELELRIHLQLPGHCFTSESYLPPVSEPSVACSPTPSDSDFSRTHQYLLFLENDIRRITGRIQASKGKNLEDYCSEIATVVPSFEEKLEMFSFFQASIDDPKGDMRHETIKGQLFDCYDILYMPFLDAVMKISRSCGDPILNYYANKALVVCVWRMPKYTLVFETRHYSTWPMLRTCARGALMILGVIASGRSDLLPPGWQDAVLTAISFLGFWRAWAPNISPYWIVIKRLAAGAGLNVEV